LVAFLEEELAPAEHRSRARRREEREIAAKGFEDTIAHYGVMQY